MLTGPHQFEYVRADAGFGSSPVPPAQQPDVGKPSGHSTVPPGPPVDQTAAISQRTERLTNPPPHHTDPRPLRCPAGMRRQGSEEQQSDLLLRLCALNSCPTLFAQRHRRNLLNLPDAPWSRSIRGSVFHCGRDPWETRLASGVRDPSLPLGRNCWCNYLLTYRLVLVKKKLLDHGLSGRPVSREGKQWIFGARALDASS